MIQPTPHKPANGQGGEPLALRHAASDGGAWSGDSRVHSDGRDTLWLELFPVCDVDQALVAVARMWRQATSRTCFVIWNSAETSHRFALAGVGDAGSLPSRPAWMRRVHRVTEADVLVGEMTREVVCSEWLAWLGLACSDRELITTPLALESASARGRLCIAPADGPGPAIDPIGLEATTRALWQATLCESQLHQRKLSALAELAAGAGHEINNPLGTILGRSQQLLRDEQHPERRRWLATIGAQSLRIRDMIGDLMLFAHPVPPRLTHVDLARVIREVTAKFVRQNGSGIAIEEALGEGLLIAADPTQVEIVFSELVRNSIHAMKDGGTIRIAAERTASIADPGRQIIQVTFSDTGRGLSEHEREHLFDPFFSGRQAGRGLGFGLSKCWKILRSHGGDIRVADPGGDGCGGEAAGLMLIVDWPAAIVGAPLKKAS